MRPEKLSYLLNIGVDEKLKFGSSPTLKAILPAMKKEWQKYAKDENDYRDGRDTYGYSDEESIRNNLFYISDRWRCAFRLKWIIDGVELGYI